MQKPSKSCQLECKHNVRTFSKDRLLDTPHETRNVNML